MNKSKVVLINIMDVSGSMGTTKKSMAKLYMNTYKGFLHGQYDKIETRFISHTTVAKEVGERDFFNHGESGGTYISTGYEKALELVKEYDTDIYDVYVLHFSDGDNWGEDNDFAVKLLYELCEKVNLVQYIEVKSSSYTSTIMCAFNEIKKDNLYLGKISKVEDCFDRLKETTILEISEVKQKWSEWCDRGWFKYRTKGNRIECKFDSGIKTVAKCLPEDVYNLETGLEICRKKYQIKKLEKVLKTF